MTQKAEKVSNFVSTLVVHFPVRFVRDGEHDAAAETEWLRSIRAAVGFYDEEVLAKAAQRIIDTRTDRRFPLPAEIRKACHEVQEQINRGKLPLEDEKAKASGPWHPDRVKLAYDLLKTSMGREAAQSNWILQLWDFCRNNARLPTPGEVNELRHNANEFDGAYRETVKAPIGSLTNKLSRMGDAMLAKREELRGKALGEGA